LANLNDTFTGGAGLLSGHTADTGETWASLAGINNWTLDGSGNVYCGGLGGFINIDWSSWTPASADYSVLVTFNTDTDAGDIGFMMRGNGDTTGSGTATIGYMVRYSQPDGGFNVFKNTAGAAYTQLGSTFTHAAPANGDTLQADISGSGTTSIALSFNGSSLGAAITDSSSPHTAAGQVAVWGGGGQTTSTGVQFSRFQAGVFGSVATAFTLTGPSRGPNGGASANFTFTPTMTSLAGTWSPSTLTWSGTAEAKTSQFTPSATGSGTANGTGSPSLTQPSNVAFASAASTTGNFAYQDATPLTAVTYQIFNTDNTGWQNSASAGTSSASGTGAVSAVNIPADFVGYIQFANGGVFAVDVLTPATGGGNLPPFGGMLITRG
jgi:hypothetical protein